ncbi:MAG: hypothetical protein R3F11_07045 [Verrucomicrobiales bacterium]
MNSPFVINAARAAFVLIACLLGIGISLGFGGQAWVGAASGVGLGLFVVCLDALLKNFTFREFSNGTFGLLIGLFSAWLVTRIDLLEIPWLRSLDNQTEIKGVFELAMYFTLGFLGMSLAMRANREEFSLMIPYVRFRQDAVHDQPMLVDASVVIDGRIPRICETGFLAGRLMVPRYVIDELQLLAESRDAIKRERGKRGLESLNEIQSLPALDVTIVDSGSREKLTDAEIVQIAKRYDARILTNDANLGQIARLRGVTALNLNELAKAVAPVLAPGDIVEINLVREGKDDHQAVGYTADGTMIVVNHAASRIGAQVDVIISGAVQTNAGRLVFAELKDAA